ncbi:transcriptional regulator (plasmid) [Clostridium botulinum A2B3 87]|uniref:helix-turn-helix domain-containing protein n=1 Tax=Clostridium botulinum TaxID=1491 RepID=UPI0004A59D91|nr:helix-turn-helix transcriptional regulator [Clostridium botulinum]KRU29343.1 transcriptional regulator [Clostridium sporogenes]KEI94399.1 transcriptional regulator [Clostridium botulinum A2B3 87]KRU33431.1 transcriptional regulator [Clostridium sporogenes]KRU33937.1 transcriptional regulator [Clostridium sporogenes]KRU43415.1 transcriptional regulator [Clostridium sporogenes]
MNTRVKQIRNSIGLTQEDFAKKIDLKRSSLANIESGSVKLTERNIKTICNTFNVNENWLVSGEGEMFNTLQEDKELLNFVINTLADKNQFIKDTFLTLARLDETEWAVIEKIINNLKAK